MLRKVTIEACLDAGFTPIISQETADSFTVFALVAAGMGVTLAPHMRQPVWPVGVVFIPLTGVTRRLRSAIAWRVDQAFPALGNVLQLAEQVMPTLRYELPPD